MKLGLALWHADSVIGNIRKQYIDTRTQANLSKLHGKCQQDQDIITFDMSEIVERRRRSGNLHSDYCLILLHPFHYFVKIVLTRN